MLYYLVAFLYVLSCFLLLLVVLLQQGKGGDMASAFGGGGSQTAFGARAGATVLTKATTVLGVIPLLPDVFWAGLAVTIMAGLTIGTVFTMIAVPVLYATFYRIRRPGPAAAGPTAEAA